MFGFRVFRRCAVALVVLSLTLVAGASPALAATTLNVTTTADVNPASGVCASGSTVVPSPLSLREATCLANNIGGTVTINLPAGTYKLSYGELQPGKNSGQNVSIVGAGAASTIIDGQDLSRVLDYDVNIVGGVTSSVSDVTITNGRDGTFGGAGIIAGSGNKATLDTLTVSDSVISNNQANFAVPTASNKPGGGIEFQGGNLHLSNDTFSGNESFSSDGGAVSYQAIGLTTGQTLTVDGSTFTNNSTANSGASGTSGGALAVSAGGGGGTYTVTNSTFTGNTSSSSGSGEAAAGGAIFEVTGNLTVTGSTFTGNGVSGSGAYGGAVIYTAGAATMHYNRFAGNTGTGVVMTNSGSGTANVTDNWWGCNTGPNTTGCDTTSGTAITGSPWITLKTAASPSTINYGASSSLTASFLQDSAGNVLTAAQVAPLVGLPVSWKASNGSASGDASIGSNGEASGTFTAGSTSAGCGAGSGEAEVDSVPDGDSLATASVTVQCPDLTVTKTDDVSGSTQLANGGACPPQCWSWKLAASNSGAGFAVYSNGQTIVSDNLPNANVSYGSVTEKNVSGVTGTIDCSISTSDDLSCTANGSVQIGSGGSFTVSFVATPSATGTFANPRSGGSCAIDSGNDVPETNDSNNSCSDSVSVTAPDLTVANNDNVGGATTLGNGWTWDLGVANSSSSTAATFQSGDTILTDDLDNSGNVVYGTPGAGNGTGVTNIAGVSCSIASSTLTCTATGTVTIGAGGGFDVTFTATPSAVGTYANPRSGGTCAVDPSNVVPETDDSNNGCSGDSVAVSAPDLTASQADSVGGQVVAGQGWNWTVTVANGGGADAVFAAGATLLRDDLDSSGGVSYGTPSVMNVANVTNSGSIQCAIDSSSTLTCTANGSPVTVGASSGSFDVVIPVSSTQPGSYTNPGSSGICRVDPSGAVSESDETNNDCNSDSVTAVAPPAITKVSPSSGPVSGGTPITITGSGFGNTTATVLIGQGHGTGAGALQATNVQVISPTKITATTPGGAITGTFNVFVQTPGGGTSRSVSGDQFTYFREPVISKLAPSSGSVSGGTSITITGSGFTTPASVVMGQGPGVAPLQATNVQVVSPTEITAVTPGGAIQGTHNVFVQTSGGTSVAVKADQFTYLPDPAISTVSPGSGPVSGGTAITITGSGFGTSTASVLIGQGHGPGTGALLATNVQVLSPTEITATTPGGAIQGTFNVFVSTPTGGTSLPASGATFTYLPRPTITTVSPNSGSVSGGTAITITGSGFTTPASVLIGQGPGKAPLHATNVQVLSPTQITATTPGGAVQGTFNVLVQTPGGTSPAVKADQFTYLPDPAISSISPNSGPVSGGTPITITGSGFGTSTATVLIGQGHGPTTGALKATNVHVISPTQITATTPGGAIQGTFNTYVQTPTGGTSLPTTNDTYTYTP